MCRVGFTGSEEVRVEEEENEEEVEWIKRRRNASKKMMMGDEWSIMRRTTG